MMEINESTKIASVLKHHPEALNALVAVSSRFEKLRNPLLRKLMAGRTSLKEAAKIGGCSMNDIAGALVPMGFTFVEKEGETKEKTETVSSPFFANDLEKYPTRKLDVRDVLAAGKDPLKMIMAAVKELPPDHLLQLINTFEPTPLISLLKNKGYESFVQHVHADEVHTYFKQKGQEKQSLEEESPGTVSLADFNKQLETFGDKIIAVDVRDMEMPLPMVTILESLERLETDCALLVQHKRIPVFLFSELKERAYSYILHQANDMDVRLLIWKNKQ